MENILVRAFYCISDKIASMVNKLETVDEFHSYKVIKNYAEQNLDNFDYKKNGELIWNTLFTDKMLIQKDKIVCVYNIKKTYLYDIVLARVKFYIENKLWNLLDAYDVNTWTWSNEQVFLIPGLFVYLIILKNGEKVLILASLKDKKLSFIESYDEKNIDVNLFKRRQIVFKDGFFYSI